MNSASPLQTIVLASASPQRSALLTQIQIPYIVIRSDIDEEAVAGDPEGFALEVARKKAVAVYTKITNGKEFARRDAASDDALVLSRILDTEELYILGADTLIDIDDEILGKPTDPHDAETMIRRLSGREHEVITAMTLLTVGRFDERLSETHEAVHTKVQFAELSETEITRYIDSGDWKDAAGAYRIQSLGATFIEGISGSYTNVVGLPLRRFYGMLLRSGYYPT